MRRTSFSQGPLRALKGWPSLRQSLHPSAHVRRCFYLPLPIVSAVLLAISPHTVAQSVSVTTYHNDNSRRGLNDKETILTHANVNPAQFGKVFSQTIDEYSYAQPLYVPGVNIPGMGVPDGEYL